MIMEKELNYLSCKIKYLESQIDTLESNKDNFTSVVENAFYVSQFTSLNEEKELLENIFNYVIVNTFR